MKLFKKLAKATSFTKAPGKGSSAAPPLATPAGGVQNVAKKAEEEKLSTPRSARKSRADMVKEYKALREENIRLREKNRLLLQLVGAPISSTFAVLLQSSSCCFGADPLNHGNHTTGSLSHTAGRALLC